MFNWRYSLGLDRQRMRVEVTVLNSLGQAMTRPSYFTAKEVAPYTWEIGPMVQRVIRSGYLGLVKVRPLWSSSAWETRILTRHDTQVHEDAELHVGAFEFKLDVG